jgi:hypothetical protein
MYTKKQLLGELREVRRKLELPRVERAVKLLPIGERQRFVEGRIGLDNTITRLQTALVRDIRERLDAEEPVLRSGIEALRDSLSDIQKVGEWPVRIAKVLDAVGRIVGLVV